MLPHRNFLSVNSPSVKCNTARNLFGNAQLYHESDLEGTDYMICMHLSMFAPIHHTKPAPIFVLRCHDVQICRIIRQRIRGVPNLYICSGISLWSPGQEPWNTVSNEQTVFYNPVSSAAPPPLPRLKPPSGRERKSVSIQHL